ncbi:MAG: 50S ribosomal protein L23 [Alphaproteobacteria bacterium]|nr:50S ribosomal protein L23 [Alphaproteobacteria bacterium]
MKKSTKEKEVKTTSTPSELSEISMYDLIRHPVVTEKVTLCSQYNQIVFRVPLDANKTQIKQAVEKIFSVKVKAVNTLRQQGKRKMFRGRPGVRPSYKKAMITLVEGHSIDIATGV